MKFPRTDPATGELAPVATAMLETVMALLRGGQDPASLTARDITERSGCALGLLNYHFGDRDSLVRLAADALIREATGGYFENVGSDPSTARRDQFLESMLNVSRVMLKLGPIGEFAARQALLRDDYNLSASLLPSMGANADTPDATRLQMRLRAIHFLAGLQAMLARRRELEAQTGIDMASDDFLQTFIRDLARRELDS